MILKMIYPDINRYRILCNSAQSFVFVANKINSTNRINMLINSEIQRAVWRHSYLLYAFNIEIVLWS